MLGSVECSLLTTAPILSPVRSVAQLELMLQGLSHRSVTFERQALELGLETRPRGLEPATARGWLAQAGPGWLGLVHIACCSLLATALHTR